MEYIGNKLRQLRSEKGLTLKQVAQKVNCTPAFLSQIENDKASPSIATLKKIAQVFNVRIVDFFIEEVNQDPVVQGPADWRKVSLANWRADIKQMVPGNGQKRMQPFFTTIEPGGGSEGGYTHEGEEFGLVLEGTLTLKVGEDTHQVPQGSSFYYSSLLPHAWTNREADKCVVIWVVSPPSW